MNLLNSASADPTPSAVASDSLTAETQQRLLRFSIDHQDSALFPLAQIVEILRLNIADILPIPDLPSCILGIYNWRGEMLWLLDFNALFNYPALLPKQTTLSAIVIQENQPALGFVVSQVQDIEFHDLQDLQAAVANLFSSSLLPFVLGVLPTTSDPVLDASAIVRSRLWQKSSTNAKNF